MDEKTGLPTTTSGNNAFWVFVDKLSRRCHIVVCPEKQNAESVARMFFDHVFKNHGVPLKIISDRDPRFTSHFWKHLCGILGINLNMSTSNHPETDGQSERYIRTISEMIRVYADANPLEWDKYVPGMEFAYNDSIHPSTGFTPFQLDTGRNPVSPISFILQGLSQKSPLYRVANDSTDPTEYIRKMAETIRAGRKNLLESSLKQAARLNRNITPPSYKVGDMVYMKHPKADTPSHVTMDPRFVGPCKIIEKISESAYRLELPTQYKYQHNVINVHKLKPYHERTEKSDVLVPAVPATPSTPVVQDLRAQMHPTEKRTLVAQVKVEGMWVTLQHAITGMKLWRVIHRFIQGCEKAKNFNPLFSLVQKTFNSKKFCGYVVAFDQKRNETQPFLVIYSDMDKEDITQQEFDVISANTTAMCNAIERVAVKQRQRDASYHVFPKHLADLYAKITMPYTMDAMEHPSGQTSKAPLFCSKENSVFSHSLTRQSVWANPDFDEMKSFLSHFLSCYDRDTERTSLMLVAPVWMDKAYWKLLHRFRLMDLFPTGTSLFVSPDYNDAARLVSKGVTRWPVAVLYLGCRHQSQRLWNALRRAQLTSADSQRVTLVQGREYCLTGDAAADGPVLTDLADKILSKFGPMDVLQ
jgi:hypothetical protein